MKLTPLWGGIVYGPIFFFFRTSILGNRIFLFSTTQPLLSLSGGPVPFNRPNLALLDLFLALRPTIQIS